MQVAQTILPLRQEPHNQSRFNIASLRSVKPTWVLVPPYALRQAKPIQHSTLTIPHSNGAPGGIGWTASKSCGLSRCSTHLHCAPSNPRGFSSRHTLPGRITPFNIPHLPFHIQMVPPAGFEPTLPAPETGALSIELRGPP